MGYNSDLGWVIDDLIVIKNRIKTEILNKDEEIDVDDASNTNFFIDICANLIQESEIEVAKLAENIDESIKSANFNIQSNNSCTRIGIKRGIEQNVFNNPLVDEFYKYNTFTLTTAPFTFFIIILLKNRTLDALSDPEKGNLFDVYAPLIAEGSLPRSIDTIEPLWGGYSVEGVGHQDPINQKGTYPIVVNEAIVVPVTDYTLTIIITIKNEFVNQLDYDFLAQQMRGEFFETVLKKNEIGDGFYFSEVGCVFAQYNWIQEIQPSLEFYNVNFYTFIDWNKVIVDFIFENPVFSMKKVFKGR